MANIKELTKTVEKLPNIKIQGLNPKPFAYNPMHESIKQELEEEVFRKFFGPKYRDTQDLDMIVAACLTAVISPVNYKYNYVFLYWTFVFDDMLEQKDQVFIGKWKKKFASGYGDEDTPMDHTFNYYVNGWKKFLPDDLIQKMLDDMVHWCVLFDDEGAVQEFEEHIQTMDSDKYFASRLTDAAAKRGFTWIEVYLNTGNLMEIRKNDSIKKVLDLFDRMAGEFMIKINDVYSLKKDVLMGSKFNYVFLTMKRKGLTLQEAVESVVKQILENSVSMREYGDQLKKFKLVELDEYVDTIISSLDNAHYWSSKCARYNNLSIYQ